MSTHSLAPVDGEPQFTSLKERIAALKLQNGGPGGGTSPTPPPAPRPLARPAASANNGLRKAAPEPSADIEIVPPSAPRRPSATTSSRGIPPAPEDDGDQPALSRRPSDTPPTRPRPPIPGRKALPASVFVRGAQTATGTNPAQEPEEEPTRRGSTASTSSGRSIPPRPSDSASRPPPPVPGRKAMPASVFVKGPLKKPHAPEAEKEPEPEPEAKPPFAVNGRTMPPTLPGMKPASSAHAAYHVPPGHEQEDEEPAVVAAVATVGRKVPPVPGTRPPLPSRSSEDKPVPARPPVPSTARPSLPTSARPALPGRPTLPTRRSPAAQPAPLPEKESEPEPAITSVAARAAALGRRLPPPATGGKPPPLPAMDAEPVAERPQVPAGRQQGPPPVPGNRPPPVPMASRPRTAAAAVPRVDLTPAPPFDYASAPQGSACLLCRDFSAPDKHAAQFPLASLPRDDPVGYLAAALCKPFDSATDKARAIFTWCHHNIAYDVDGFFGGCIPHGQTTGQQIFSGKAVCEGYANIFSDIAQRAGLEAVKIGGHGKGYGFTGYHPGEPLPEITGHAWNAVRIDGGEWKLVDACWGAGHVEPGRYIKRFEPSHFNSSNEIFGRRHYPGDQRSFYRADGAMPTWEEYLLGDTNGAEAPEFYGNGYEEGFDKASLQPAVREVHVAAYNGDYVRFLVSHVCEHWDGATHGPGPMYPFLLNINTNAGKKEMLPLETDGYWYWRDVPAHELEGGGEVFLSLVTMINDQDARGKSNDYFLQMRGRASMSWTHVAKWDLV